MQKEAKQARQQGKKTEEKSTAMSKRDIYLVAVVIVVGVAVFATLAMLLSKPGVPFSTFKSNFYAAPKSAIVVVFRNQSEFISESACYPLLREAIHKNLSSVSLFLINASNSTCLFSPNVTPMTIVYKPASYCLSIASSEPSIFLNYSSINASIVTAYRLTILGNAEYMQQCPIAVDMS